ncbi:MAG: DUF4907 domain-containing protein [Bacteroidota bacterium]
MKNNYKYLIAILLVFAFFLLLMLLINNKDEGQQPYNEIRTDDGLRLELEGSRVAGWGYKVFRNDKLLIHQKNIPAIEGNQTFLTADDAEKVGRLVIKKINQEEIPIITRMDLMKLNIKYTN